MNTPEMRLLSSEGVPAERARGNPLRRVVINLLIALVCGGLLIWFIGKVRAGFEDARCRTCECKLEMLWLGLTGFDSANDGLPPVYLCDGNGRPMHSWQSMTKPFMGYYGWRGGYSMKEPWNGPNNRIHSSYRDSTFHCPSVEHQADTLVDYVAVVGPDTMWPGRERVKLPTKEDGNRDTILLIELPDSDYSNLEPRSPTVEEFLERVKSPTGKGIRSIHPKGLAYVTVSGEVRWFPPATDPETIRRLLKRDPTCRVVSLEKMMPLIEHWEEAGDAGK